MESRGLTHAQQYGTIAPQYGTIAPQYGAAAAAAPSPEYVVMGQAVSADEPSPSAAGSGVWVAVGLILILGIAVAALFVALANARSIDDTPSADYAADIEDMVADSGWIVREGTGISDQGWIIGTGMAPGGSEWHAILITDAEVVVPIVPGDANGDGVVNDEDAAALAANWQKQGGALLSEGDFNADGNVDDLDATILAANWQGSGPPPESVPEPTSLALLLCAAIYAMLLIRRR